MSYYNSYAVSERRQGFKDLSGSNIDGQVLADYIDRGGGVMTRQFRGSAFLVGLSCCWQMTGCRVSTRSSRSSAPSVSKCISRSNDCKKVGVLPKPVWNVSRRTRKMRVAANVKMSEELKIEVSHNKGEEEPEAKARWFQSLTLTERIEMLCSITDLILANNPAVADKRDDESASRRVRVVSKTRS